MKNTAVTHNGSVFHRIRGYVGIALFLAFAQSVHAGTATGRSVTWWIIADTHIGAHVNGARTLGKLNAAVEDANALELSQKAIILGDLVHDHPYWIPYYEAAMNNLRHEWIDVLGNHDFDRWGSGRRVKHRTYFSKTIGGVRFIALSDDGKWEDGDAVEGYQTEKNLKADQDAWFRAELERHPDKPTVLWTHQGLRRMFEEPRRDQGPCFWDPERRGWLQENWGRYNIVMWIHGHTHEWALEEDYQGLGFVDVTPRAVRHRDGGGIFLNIDPGDKATTLSLRFRDHINREWIAVNGHEEYVMTIPNTR